MQRVRIIIHGIVQGVFFRAETKRQADLLGLTGWVRNTDDGKVEILVQGEGEVLGQLEKWAYRGPSAAIVTDGTSAKIRHRCWAVI